MKLQLLGLYVQNAENVEERDDKTKEYARKKTTKNLKPIYKQSSIIVNGKSVRLDTYDLDAMSKKTQISRTDWTTTWTRAFRPN